MKFLTLVVFIAVAVLALADDDGKYRPEATTKTPLIVPVTTTLRPKWNDPRWSDPRWAGHQGWNNNHWNNNWNRYNSTWNDWNRPAGAWGSQPWTGNRYNVDALGRPITRHPDWRTIRLDEKADVRGYQYVYETVGGILVEENGTFENIGLRHEGVRAVGVITITDRDGVTYKLTYQSDSKEAYIPRGAREPDRIPPSLTRLLALMETHK
ncbi:uncharacterized protein [Chironomus tepperi]|uniref:uncharacterized protein n=1 Tax=Chironomus tepperi TaxID=113505 RepID=UPI00391F5FBB